MTPLPKKSSDRVRRYLTPLLTLVTASVCSAQTTAAPKDAPKEEEVIVLTPFTVDASKDKGYYAENTLAGSRLRTNISDLAASISVVTKQQLDDTASVDINDVFRYEINTEGSTSYTAAVQSLRTDGIIDTNAGFTAGGNGIPLTNATSNRVRGLGVPSFAINYYPTIAQIPVDSYNVASLEISRGPNSMLFGLGSPAGIVNQSWATAILNRDKYQVQFRADNNGSIRASASINKSLIKDKLSIYVAALDDRRRFVRKPSYDNTVRKYGTLTIKPLEKTTIRLSVETYKNDNRRPNTLTPRDGVTEWRKGGEPIYDDVNKTITTKDGRVTGPYILDAASPFAAAARAGVIAAAGSSYNAALWNSAQTFYNGINIFNENLMSSYQDPLTGIPVTSPNPMYRPGITISTQSRTVMRISNGQLVDWFQPLGNIQYRTAWGTTAAPESAAPTFPAKNAAAGGAWFVNQASPLIATNADYINRYWTQSTFSSNNGSNLGSFKYPGVTDKSIYDYTEINTNQMNFGSEKNTTYNVELEQEITHDLFFNAGWLAQDFKSTSNYTVAQLNVGTLFVDTNKYMPDGSPNPYVGKPYVEDFDPDQFVNNEKADHKRAMLAYTPDFTKHNSWLKHLGHHQLLGLWSSDESIKTFRRKRLHYIAAGSDAGKYRFLNNQNNTAAGAATGWNYNSTSLQHKFYLAGPNDPNGTVTRSSGEWDPITYTGNIQVYDYATNAFQNLNMTTNYIDRPEGTGRNQRKVKSLSFGMTNYFWNDRLITTFGIRKDNYRGRSTTNAAILRQELSKGDPVNDVDVVTGKVVAAGRGVAIVKGRTAQENYPAGYYETNALFSRWNRWDIISGTTRTIGGVLKPFKGWSANDRRAADGSLFAQFIQEFGISYNKSNNFNPPDTAQVDVFGRPLPKPTGDGKDYGFQFALMNGKLFARVTWFDSTNINERTDPGTSISRLTNNVDRDIFRVWARTIAKINMGKDPTTAAFNDSALTTAEETTVQNAAAVIWKQSYTYYDDVGTIYATRDAKAKGVEMQINYNPTKNWTMKLTGGKQTTVYSNALQQFDDWYAVRKPIWDAARAADYLLPAYQGYVTANSSIVGFTLVNGDKVNINDFWNSYGYAAPAKLTDANGNYNAQLYYDGVVTPQITPLRDLNGQAAPGQRRYRSSLITNYTFSQDRFKGFFVGGSQRWESKAIIGYMGKPSGVNLRNPQLLEVSDLTKPVYDKANFYTDVWIGYSRKILSGKVGMRLQLNINDAFENGGLKPVGVNFNGQPYAFRIVDSRQYVLTTTFEF